MRLLPALATSTWLAGYLGDWARFHGALRDPERAQRTVLERLLAQGRDSAFGREHGLHRVRSLSELRDAVPIRSYDEHEPWITRAAAGERDVLTTSPLLAFEPSSGSTRARKLLPTTEALRREFQLGMAPWVVDLYRHRARLAGGPAYWSISPVAREERTAGGHPIGFAEDSAYLGGMGKRLVDAALVVPGTLATLHDVDDFWRASALFLLRARDLRLVSVWNPSFLTLLMGRIARDFEHLVQDLRVGVRLGAVEIAPAPERANELLRCDPADGTTLWPALGLVSAWTDARAAADLPAVAAAFPGVEIQPKGLLATEAFVSLPYGRHHPLAIRSHLFEFERDDGNLALAHELQPGDEVTVIVTTGAGLWRYRLGDRIRVTGLVKSTPSVRFLGRADCVSDLRGEKLSEAFVGAVLAELGLTDRFAMLAPEGAGYTLFVERPGPDLAGRLEEELRRNPHYRWCVTLDQLRPVEVVAVGPSAKERYLQARVRGGARLGDIKTTALATTQGWRDSLVGD